MRGLFRVRIFQLNLEGNWCQFQIDSSLCVDADTKVFPDSLSRMVSCSMHDE